MYGYKWDKSAMYDLKSLLINTARIFSYSGDDIG